MDHYTKIANRLTELKSYPNPTKVQLVEIVSILEEFLLSRVVKNVSVPFTIEDCEELRDGRSFEWEFNGVTLDIYNCDIDLREDDE